MMFQSPVVAMVVLAVVPRPSVGLVGSLSGTHVVEFSRANTRFVLTSTLSLKRVHTVSQSGVTRDG